LRPFDETESMTPKRTSSVPEPGRLEGKWAIGVASLPLILFLVLPIAVLVLAGVRELGLASSRPDSIGAPPLVAAKILPAIRLSLVTSALTTLFSVLLGLPVAYLLARFRFRGKEMLDTLMDLPMVLPPVAAGVGLLLVFGRMGIVGKYFDAAGIRIAFSSIAVVMAQTFVAAPFFVRTARAGFEAVPERFENAAMTLGRNRWGTFWSVSFPLARPAIAAGAVLAFARAASEFGATMMFAGNLPGVTQTLPLAVMSAMEESLGLAIAISTISLALALFALLGSKAAVRKWGR